MDREEQGPAPSWCVAPECGELAEGWELCPVLCPRDRRLMENACHGKVRHTEEEAKETAQRLARRGRTVPLPRYSCGVCLCWHLGNGRDAWPQEIVVAAVAAIGEPARARLAQLWKPGPGQGRVKQHNTRVQGGDGLRTVTQRIGAALDDQTLAKLKAIRDG